jgi:hypothetical protein
VAAGVVPVEPFGSAVDGSLSMAGGNAAIGGDAFGV